MTQQVKNESMYKALEFIRDWCKCECVGEHGDSEFCPVVIAETVIGKGEFEEEKDNDN